MMRLPSYVARIQGGAMAAKTVLRVVSESPGTLLLDGGNGPGHVACARAMDMAVDRARANGVGAVAIRNSNHNGTQAAYAMRASDRAPGVQRIYVPGEIEHAHVVEAARLGVPVEAAVLNDLEALGRRLGVPWD